jgi:hypothetical protein
VSGHRQEVADVFRQHEQEFLQRWGHTHSAHQLRAFRDICACRTAALGAHLEQCDHCSHQAIAYNSCRNRHCPKCQSTARDKWLAARSAELLPVPYCHVVFTLPAGAVHAGASKFALVLHTWNQKMLPHPHLHCLVPSGGLSPDRSQWMRCRRRFFLPVKVLGRLFRGKFLDFLGAAFHQKKLRLFGTLTKLKNLAEFDRLLHQLRSVNWVVFAKRPFGGPEYVIRYLARYTHRVAIANGRLVEMQNGQVTFRWRDSADGNQQKLMTLDAIEFIRRYLLHVLPPGFVKIRHFGFLANRNRREALLLCRSLLPTPATASLDPLTATQRQALKRTCPICKIGTLHILDWILPSTFFAIDRKPVVDSS